MYVCIFDELYHTPVVTVHVCKYSHYKIIGKNQQLVFVPTLNWVIDIIIIANRSTGGCHLVFRPSYMYIYI